MSQELLYYDTGSGTFLPLPFSSTTGNPADNTPVSRTEHDKKAERATQTTATLTVAGWSAGNTPPYTQTLTVSGLTSTSNGSVALSTAATQAQYKEASAAMLRPSAQGTNSITITAEGLKPSVDLPVVITRLY